MKKIKFIFNILFILLAFQACKEEPLEPYELAALSQQAAINEANGVGNGGDSGGGNGGGGGGQSVDEYFSAEVDGILKTGVDPFYQDAFGIKQINSAKNSITDLFQINIFGTLEVKTYDFPYISYFKTTTSIYEAYNGKLIIDSLTTDLIQGTFYFDAEKSSGLDTISVTNGRFRVER